MFKTEKHLLILLFLFQGLLLNAQNANIRIANVIQDFTPYFTPIEVPVIMDEVDQEFSEMEISFSFTQSMTGAYYSDVLFTNALIAEEDCSYGGSSGVFFLNWSGMTSILPEAGDTLFVVKFSWGGSCFPFSWNESSTSITGTSPFNLTLMDGSICTIAQPTATLTIPDQDLEAGLIEVPIILEEVSGGEVLDVNVAFDYETSNLIFEDVTFVELPYTEYCEVTVASSEVSIYWTYGGVPPAPTPVYPGDTLFIVQFQWNGTSSDFIWNTDDTYFHHEPPVGNFDLTFNNGSVYDSTPPVSNPPENLSATIVGDHIEINWDYPGYNTGNPPPTDLEGYNIYQNGSLLSFVTESSYTTLESETQYCITAITSGLESEEVCVTTPDLSTEIENFETGDFTKYEWEMEGDEDWTIETNAPYGGNYSAKSGTIGDANSSALTLLIQVPEDGQISFYYKTSTETDKDKLHFSIDGLEMGNWSGINDWQQASYDISCGVHLLRWEYEKDNANSAGEDAVWLDDIVFPELGTGDIPAPSNLTASVQNYYDVLLNWDAASCANSYGIFKRNDAMEYEAIGTTSGLSYTDTGLTMGETYYYAVSAIYETGVPGGISSDMIYVEITVPTVEFPTEDFETGDFSKFDWQQGGDSPWEIDSGNAHQGSFSSKSGDIEDNESSKLWLTRNILAAGVVSFYCKVSSEAGFDKLTFYLDGVEMQSWSGENDWEFVSFDIETTGIHSFKWAYSKDNGISSGDDAAWIDDIVLPVSEPECIPLNADFEATPDAGNPYTYQFTDLSTGSIGAWSWNFGDDENSTLQNPTHTYSEPGTYQIILTITSSCSYCSDTDTLQITIEENSFFNLGGTVYGGELPIDEGFAYLYKMEDNQIVDVFASFISEYGYYDFYQLTEGDYILKAELSPNSSIFGEYIPTYYGNVSSWVDATTIQLQSDIWDANVQLIPVSSSSSGTGQISGQVIKNSSPKEENGPVANVEVLLKNQDDMVLDITYTDEEGNYLFENLEMGDYQIIVEITGKYCTPAEITLTEDTPIAENMVFFIDDNNIALSIQDHLPNSIGYIGEIYPNPSSNNANLCINVKEATMLSWQIMDISGKIIMQQNHPLFASENTIEIDLYNIDAGIYFLKLSFENKYQTTRKLIKR
jgi:PKD repeat protein